MERQSNLHSARVDDELAHEVESLTRGAPVEARVDPDRAKEDAGDGEPTPEAVIAEPNDPIAPVALTHEEVRARSELAIHLLPSRFPMTRTEVIDCAIEQDAPEQLLDTLDRLPEDNYANVEQVWEALGGRREERTHHDAEADAEPETQAGSEPEPEPELQPEPLVESARPEPSVTAFEFSFDWRYRAAALPFGVHPGSASVQIDARVEPPVLHAAFGPWRVATPVDNVVATEITGPYSAIKTIGPAHVSLHDGGLTFATNGHRGLCIRFREPVRGIEPLGVVRHAGLTVTVRDPESLRSTLERTRDRNR